MDHLRPCPSCNRHVVASTTRCPFCEGGLELDRTSPSEPPPGLRRAALMAFVALASCKDPAPPSPQPIPNLPVASTAPTTSPAPTEPTTPAAPAASSAAAQDAEAPKDAGKKTATTATTGTTAAPTFTHRMIKKPYGAPFDMGRFDLVVDDVR